MDVANKSSEKMSANLRALIYSFLEFRLLNDKICKLSK